MIAHVKLPLVGHNRAFTEEMTHAPRDEEAI